MWDIDEAWYLHRSGIEHHRWLGNVVLNVVTVDNHLLWMRAENIGFGDTQEYLRTRGPTSPWEIMNHLVMIPTPIMVERLEGVQPSILQRPRISLPWEWKIWVQTRKVWPPISNIAPQGSDVIRCISSCLHQILPLLFAKLYNGGTSRHQMQLPEPSSRRKDISIRHRLIHDWDSR